METAEIIDTSEHDGFEPVESSQIRAFRYFPETQNLLIRFPGGAVYQYSHVSEMVVTAFRGSESKGKFFGANIQEQYATKKLSGKAPEEGIVPAEAVKVEVTKLEAEALKIVDQAKALTITCKADAEAVVRFNQARKSVISTIKDFLSKPKKTARAAWQAIMDSENSIVKPNEEAWEIGNGKLLAWDAEQTRLALEKARIDREAAEKVERERREKEEADRKARQKIEDEARAKEEARIKAERDKLEAEKKAQADALAQAGKAAEADRITKRAAAQAEIDRLMDEQKKLKEENERLEVELAAKEALEAPVEVWVPEPPVEKVEGQTLAKTWKAEVVDLKTLCRSVAEGRVPVDCISINQSRLNQLAKTWKSETAFHFPGVRGVEEKSVRI